MHVHVTITPREPKVLDEWLDHRYSEECKGYRDDTITIEEIRRATASIPIRMSDAVHEDRGDY